MTFDELSEPSNPVRVENVLWALIKLNGKGTLSQIEKKILEIYNLPKTKGSFKDRDGTSLVKEPLDKMIKYDSAVELKSRTYVLRKEFLKCKTLLDYGNIREKLTENKEKEIMKTYDNRKNIEDYIEGELMVKFEKKVTIPFIEEFISLLGYEILEHGFEKYYIKELENHALIKIPKGKEREILEKLENYKGIIEMASLNGMAKNEKYVKK